MEGLTYVINQLGIALSQANAALQAANARNSQLEQQLKMEQQLKETPVSPPQDSPSES